MVFDLLREASWDERQLDLLRWLRVRYVVLDRRRAEQTDAPPPAALASLLGRAGLLEGERVFPDEQMTVYVLKAAPASPPPSHVKPMFTLNGTFLDKRPSLIVWLNYRSRHWILERRQRPLEIQVRGYDSQGGRVWSRTLRQELPQFLLPGQVMGHLVQVDKGDWTRTRRVSIRARMRGLGIKLQEQDVRRRDEP
jgi:hypothetical protein